MDNGTHVWLEGLTTRNDLAESNTKSDHYKSPWWWTGFFVSLAMEGITCWEGRLGEEDCRHCRYHRPQLWRSRPASYSQIDQGASPWLAMLTYGHSRCVGGKFDTFVVGKEWSEIRRFHGLETLLHMIMDRRGSLTRISTNTSSGIKRPQLLSSSLVHLFFPAFSSMVNNPFRPRRTCSNCGTDDKQGRHVRLCFILG